MAKTPKPSTRTRRVYYQAWGRGRGLAGYLCRLAEYAIAQEYEGGIDAVRRSVERQTGLVCCGGPREDSHSADSTVWQLTLGRPVRGGGYAPEVELWVSITRRRD